MNPWPTRLPAMALLSGGITALFGTYWDNTWHTDFGRDNFFIPPHLTVIT